MKSKKKKKNLKYISKEERHCERMNEKKKKSKINRRKCYKEQPKKQTNKKKLTKNY